MRRTPDLDHFVDWVSHNRATAFFLLVMFVVFYTVEVAVNVFKV